MTVFDPGHNAAMLGTIQHGQAEDEFSRPVESIMRFEDFKSNFARRLSNRYVSRPPSVSPKTPTLKLVRDSPTEPSLENVPERVEPSIPLSNTSGKEQIDEIVKPPDKVDANLSAIRNTEVTVLNMEVETLRWQLTQTEANRQMHIALLRQIVTFLNRVKQHIEYQNNELSPKNNGHSQTSLQRSFNSADLPRSRSVVHVNKNIEYSLKPPKKMSTRKISKSISNVNGYKECSFLWSQSKLTLAPETENTRKITEEITRLTTLANTVLSTNLPDLACNFNNDSANKSTTNENKEQGDLKSNNSIESEEIMQEADANDSNGTNFELTGSNDVFNDLIENSVDSNDNISDDFVVTPMRLDSDFSNIKIHEKTQTVFFTNNKDTPIAKPRKISIDKRNDFNCNFIEDESGFSSMNSFQEIGIPIISIIPPSPCKELGYIDDIPDILTEAEKWKTGALDLQKQSVKVFWV